MSERYLRGRLLPRGALRTLPMLARAGMAPCLPAHGCHLLVRWTGDMSPLPEVGEDGARRPIIVGWAADGAEEIYTWAGITHLPNVVYRYAVAAVSPGGAVGPINPWTIQSLVFDADGEPIGLMPNAPQAISVTSLSRRPLVRWVYSALMAQVVAADFAVYLTPPGTPFDWATPTAVVTAVDGQAIYAWLGSVGTPGDEWLITVRARSADGVLSLIPRAGVGTAASYVSLEEARAVKLVIPGPLPAIAELRAEVTR